MKILVYSQVTADHIQTSLGQPEYSYYFVLKTFLPVLRRLGDVQIVENPLRDVDAIYTECQASDEPCVFLSFTPPHKVFTPLHCPVVPVFAWEYSSLPNETWDDGLFNDWVTILSRCAGALTHSSYTRQSISTALGEAFPATWAPSPVWDQFADARERILQRDIGSLQAELVVDGLVLDSRVESLDMPPPPQLHSSLEEQLRVAAATLAAERRSNEHESGATVGDGSLLTDTIKRSASSRQSHQIRTTLRSGGRRLVNWITNKFVTASVTTDGEGAEVSEKVATLRYLVQQKNKELSDKQQEIYTLSDLVRRKENELAEKQTEIYALGDVIRDKEAELFAKQNEILRVGRELGATPDALELPVERQPDRHTLELTGVVYTTVFNPADGRKNWRDMVSAFCSALGEHEDATLILKITHHRLGVGYAEILEVLQRLPPFRCRVLVLWGFLEDDSYQALIEGTAYVLNASYGEGQCMPLMEYMSCGVPAVAPTSTALADYVNENNAFVVDSSAALTFWQHDARRALRTLHYRPHWDSLVEAIRASYHCFRMDEPGYRQKQQVAVKCLQDYCSRAVVEQRVGKLLDQVTRQPGESSA